MANDNNEVVKDDDDVAPAPQVKDSEVCEADEDEDVEKLQKLQKSKNRRIFQATTTIVIEHSRRASEETTNPIADRILDSMHEDHKNIAPLMCLGLLYVLLTGDTNWFCMVLMQVGIQAMLFSKTVLRNRFARRAMVLLCLSMLITSIIAISALRPSEFQNPWGHQLMVLIFVITGFVGFVLTNLYNINLIFVFGRQANWLLGTETEDERELQ